MLYCPDWLANAGGVIAAAGEFAGLPEAEIEQQCRRIGERLTHVVTIAKEQNVPPLTAARWLAEARLT